MLLLHPVRFLVVLLPFPLWFLLFFVLLNSSTCPLPVLFSFFQVLHLAVPFSPLSFHFSSASRHHLQRGIADSIVTSRLRTAATPPNSHNRHLAVLLPSPVSPVVQTHRAPYTLNSRFSLPASCVPLPALAYKISYNCHLQASTQRHLVLIHWMVRFFEPLIHRLLQFCRPAYLGCLALSPVSPSPSALSQAPSSCMPKLVAFHAPFYYLFSFSPCPPPSRTSACHATSGQYFAKT